jgi:hypothetical protein
VVRNARTNEMHRNLISMIRWTLTSEHRFCFLALLACICVNNPQTKEQAILQKKELTNHLLWFRRLLDLLKLRA